MCDPLTIAGIALEMYVVAFENERLILRVPVDKAGKSGMRKLSSRELERHLARPAAAIIRELERDGLITVSRRIAEGHAGTLEAVNRPDGGACFTLRIPTGEVDAAPAEKRYAELARD